jgi:hypothetical protein
MVFGRICSRQSYIRVPSFLSSVQSEPEIKGLVSYLNVNTGPARHQKQHVMRVVVLLPVTTALHPVTVTLF